MNMQDMMDAGLNEQDKVNITSYFKGEERHVYGFKVIPYDIPTSCLGAYFPEANPLVSIDNVAIKSNTPVSKNIEVSLTKV